MRSWQHSGTSIPATAQFGRAKWIASNWSAECDGKNCKSGGRMSPGVTRRVEQGWTSRSREARLLAFVHLNVVLQEISLHQSIVWGNLVLAVRRLVC